MKSLAHIRKKWSGKIFCNWFSLKTHWKSKNQKLFAFNLFANCRRRNGGAQRHRKHFAHNFTYIHTPTHAKAKAYKYKCECVLRYVCVVCMYVCKRKCEKNEEKALLQQTDDNKNSNNDNNACDINCSKSQCCQHTVDAVAAMPSCGCAEMRRCRQTEVEAGAEEATWQAYPYMQPHKHIYTFICVWCACVCVWCASV